MLPGFAYLFIALFPTPVVNNSFALYTCKCAFQAVGCVVPQNVTLLSPLYKVIFHCRKHLIPLKGTSLPTTAALSDTKRSPSAWSVGENCNHIKWSNFAIFHSEKCPMLAVPMHRRECSSWLFFAYFAHSSFVAFHPFLRASNFDRTVPRLGQGSP